MTARVRVAAALAAMLVVPLLVPFGSSALAADVGDVVTFSELPIGTAVTTQYQEWGLHFGGEQPFVTTDGSNPTSPVLSGTPKFYGDLEIRIVDPATGAPTTSNGVTLDVGYIDNRDSVEIVAYDLEGRATSTERTNAFGINNVRIEGARIHRLTISAVTQEVAGFAIDNVRLLTEAIGITPTWMASLGDSYSSGEGLVPEGGLRYDCGTDLSRGTYVENTSAPGYFAYPSGLVRVWGRHACDTLTGSTDRPADFDERPFVTHHNKCHRHGRAYPNAVRERLGIGGDRSLFVACSGAVTENIGLLENGNWAQYWQNSPNRIAGGNQQIEDLDRFTRDIGADSATGLITVGIGGNDAGFEGIISACSFDQCTSKPRYTEDTLNRLWREVRPKLDRTFTELRTRYPDATIAVFGYPSVVTGAAECPGLPSLFDQAERKWLAETFMPRLNETISDAAKTAGVTYIDITQATAGRELCSEDPVINGLRGGDDKWSVLGNESFHPNQFGHDLITQFFIDNYTDDSRLVFTNPPPQAALPPDWDVVARFRAGDLDVSPGDQCGQECLQPRMCNADCLLQIDGNGFEPGSELKVTVYSEPQELGEVRADELGRVSAALAVPEPLEPGYHHVELVGTLAGGGAQLARSWFVVEPPLSQPVATPQALSVEVGGTLPVLLAGTVDDRLYPEFAVETQPSGGTLSGELPNLMYSPAPGFTGRDELTFTVGDGVSASIPASISIDVTPTGPPPPQQPPPAPGPTPPVDSPQPQAAPPPGPATDQPNQIRGISTSRGAVARMALTGGNALTYVALGGTLVALGVVAWGASTLRTGRRTRL